MRLRLPSAMAFHPLRLSIWLSVLDRAGSPCARRRNRDPRPLAYDFPVFKAPLNRTVSKSADLAARLLNF